MENCPNHSDMARRIGELEKRMDDAEGKIGTLSEVSVRGEEQIKTVFRILNEIKDMLQNYTDRMEKRIDRLASDLEGVKMRPARFWDGAVAAIVAAIIGAVIGYLAK